MVAKYRIAQVNIGRVRAQLDDPLMAGFVARLDEINALADSAPGFVWRLQTPEGNNTYLRPYEDCRMLLNMSVWESVEELKHYVYKTAHAELLRQRHEWFEKIAMYAALWWVQRDTCRESMKQRSGLRFSKRMGRRSLHLRSKQCFPLTRNSSKVSIGRRSNLARQPRWANPLLNI